jgi:hypothetical protein
MRFLAVAFCFFTLSLAAFGQAANGTITGTVLDPAGAVVAGADIQVKNTQTGVVYPATSTSTGNYTVTQLPPGTYEITVKFMGFKTYVHSNLQVQAAQIVREDPKLEVGAAEQSVTVTEQASLLKTESGELSHNVDVQQLDNLPILGIGGTNAGSSGVRNPWNMVALLPGTNYQSNFTIIVNGAPTNTAAFRVEGMDMTNHFVSFAQQEQQPSADAIQEVAIQTSNYAAEYGTAGGGLFNITMKSGTNGYHGTAYDYFVNEDLNAAYPFTQDVNGNKYRPRNRRNDYGGTLGGPIVIPKLYDGHNKSFFFFNWEEFLESSNITFNRTLPTTSYLNGDFSAISPNGGANFNPALSGAPAGALPSKDGLGNPIFANTIYDPLTRNYATGTATPFPGNMIPMTRFDPVSMKILSLVPSATGSNLINNGSGSNLSARTTVIPSLKLDQTVGSKGHLSFYWSKTETDSQYSTPNGNADGLPAEITQTRGTFIHSKTFRLNYDHTLTPTLLLHAGIGYTQLNFFDDAPYLTFNAQKELGLSGFLQNRQFPAIQGTCGPPAFRQLPPTCTGSLGGMQPIGTANQGQTHSFQEKPAYNLNATWVKGNHTYKFGGEVYFQGTIAQPFAGVILAAQTAVSPFVPAIANAGATALPASGLNLAGQNTGFGFANFLLGDYAEITQNAPADYRLGKAEWAFFAQDSWKVNRKLTLDYGLRYQYGTYATEQYGRLPDLAPNVANSNAGGRLGAACYGATGNCHFADNYPFSFGPRLGLAYQINDKTVLRAGWGLAYSFVPDLTIRPALSETNSPSDINGFVNIETPGALPQPSFPNLDPSLYPALGSISTAPAVVDRNAGRPPRQNQWSIGIQRQITPNFVLEASYVGNRGVWWTGAGPNLGFFEQVSPATFASYGLDPYNNAADNSLLSQRVNSPSVIGRLGYAPYPYSGFTGTLLQALEPYPQFAGSGTAITNAPTGNTYYDSLQIKATKRLSYGLQASGSFTWSKSLVSTREDFWNPGSSSKTLQATDQPFLLNANFVYTVPKFFESKSHILSQVTRDWQLGMFVQYGSGFPLTPPSSTHPNNLASVNGSTNYQIPTGQPFYLKDLNCHCINPYQDQLLNPAAWTNPAAGSWGSNALYGNFRSQRRPQESLNIGRNFRIKERMNLQIRAEFVNIFNRTYLANPSTSNPGGPLGHNGAGQLTSGFGVINATSAVGTATTPPGIPGGLLTTILPRTGTLIARFSF